LTTDDWMPPSPRRVLTTQSPWFKRHELGEGGQICHEGGLLRVAAAGTRPFVATK
jgi:hypothetical protein